MTGQACRGAARPAAPGWALLGGRRARGVVDHLDGAVDAVQLVEGFWVQSILEAALRVIASRGPKKLDGEFSLWLTIDEGVVRRVAAVPFDQAANDAFWRLE